MSFLNYTRQICCALHTQADPTILHHKHYLPFLFLSSSSIWALSALDLLSAIVCQYSVKVST